MRHIPPPIRDLGRFLAELQFVPEEDRAAAVQESWLAFLAGGDVIRAVTPSHGGSAGGGGGMFS